MHVRLKPALRRAWRDGATLQIGVDPARALLLAGLGDEEARALGRLDGTRTRDELSADPASRRLLTLLGHAGALDEDAPAPGALGPDGASLSLLHPVPGAAGLALEGRARSRVRVLGAGRVGAAVVGLLVAAGVGGVEAVDAAPVTPADLLPAGHRADVLGLPRDAAAASAGRPGGRPDIVVVAPAGSTPVTEELAERLVADRVPHLLVTVRETTGAVGPLVLPGSTACLTCVDLHRRDRDPVWPLVAAQLAEPSPRLLDACDAALATVVAGVTTLQVLALIDSRQSGGPRPASAGAALELALPDWRLRRREWAPHPSCACGAGASADAVR